MNASIQQSGSLQCSVRFLPVMVLVYDEIYAVYSFLLFQLGLPGSGSFYDGTLAKVKKVLEKFLPVVKADEAKMNAMVDAVRFFSILGCMIGTTVMEGEGAVNFDSTWMEAADILPKSYCTYDPDCNFEVKLREMCCTSNFELNCCQHNTDCAVKDLGDFMEQLPESIPLLSSCLRQTYSALSELNTALTEMVANADFVETDNLQTTG